WEGGSAGRGKRRRSWRRRSADRYERSSRRAVGEGRERPAPPLRTVAALPRLSTPASGRFLGGWEGPPAGRTPAAERGAVGCVTERLATGACAPQPVRRIADHELMVTDVVGDDAPRSDHRPASDDDAWQDAGVRADRGAA